MLPHTNAGPPPHHPPHQHRGPPQIRGGNGAIFTAGPPPLHIAPPSNRPLPNHPSHLIGGHMGGPPPAPTPLLPSLNQQPTHSIGTFGNGNNGVPLVVSNFYMLSMSLYFLNLAHPRKYSSKWPQQ